MKKIIVILGLLMSTFSAAYAGLCDNFTCPSGKEGVSLGLSNFTGTNFISEQIGNALIKKVIKKDSKGSYKVNLQSYNLSSLKKGIFKSLTIDGKDTYTDGIYISMIKLKTLCDFNYVEVNSKEKTTTFHEDFGMAYAFQITQEDLNKTMKGEAYKEMIRRMNSIGNASKIFNIVSTSVKIENNKFKYIMTVGIPVLNVKQDIIVETGFMTRGGEIVLNETNLIAGNYKFDLSKLEKLLNYLNPLEFSLGVFNNDDVKTQVREVTIEDNKVNIGGIFVIPQGVVIAQ